jgi:predicted amidohydrolase
VNRTGVDGNGLEYEESSCVFSPMEKKFVFGNLKVKIFDLNLDKVIQYRKNFPIKRQAKRCYRCFTVK